MFFLLAKGVLIEWNQNDHYFNVNNDFIIQHKTVANIINDFAHKSIKPSNKKDKDSILIKSKIINLKDMLVL